MTCSLLHFLPFSLPFYHLIFHLACPFPLPVLHSQHVHSVLGHLYLQFRLNNYIYFSQWKHYYGDIFVQNLEIIFRLFSLFLSELGIFCCQTPILTLDKTHKGKNNIENDLLFCVRNTLEPTTAIFSPCKDRWRKWYKTKVVLVIQSS